MDERDRALATELVYGVLRHRSSLDRRICDHSRRRLQSIDSVVLTALRIAIYQIDHLTRIPPAAAVNEAVRLVRSRRGRGAAAFANAILRALCREPPGGATGAPDPAAGHGESDDAGALAETHSFPVHLVERFLSRYGPGQTRALLQTLNRPAPMVLRVTRRAGGVTDLQRRLRDEGIESVPSELLEGVLRVAGGGAPQRTSAFRDGLFYIQDEASQLVAHLLRPIAQGQSVLDLCAAPGGKLLAILDDPAAAEAIVVAADRALERLRMLRDNGRRLGQQGHQTLVMDALRPALRRRFDRILLDAPCSGTGIIRRHPEIRWRRDPEHFARFAAQQAELLRQAVDLLAPGGRLVYAVCSLEPEEGSERIEAILRERPGVILRGARELLPPEAHRLVTEDGCLFTLPQRDDLDGFFAAALECVGA